MEPPLKTHLETDSVGRTFWLMRVTPPHAELWAVHKIFCATARNAQEDEDWQNWAATNRTVSQPPATVSSQKRNNIRSRPINRLPPPHTRCVLRNCANGITARTGVELPADFIRRHVLDILFVQAKQTTTPIRRHVVCMVCEEGTAAPHSTGRQRASQKPQTHGKPFIRVSIWCFA